MTKDTPVSVVVMCCDGFYQRHLIIRIAQEFNLIGVIRHATPKAKGSLFSRVASYKNPLDLFRHLQARFLITGYEAHARKVVGQLLGSNGRQNEIPGDVPILDVNNVNDAKAVHFLESLKPDLVCVNGTNLLRKPILDLIPQWRFGCINLHTGLSPYSRGGNCNLFMLLEEHPELVGLTIHHIDPGIDSGDIIITARPDLEVGDNYESIEAKTFLLGIDLMLVAIRQLKERRARRVKQWESGKAFLKRTGYLYNPYLRVRVNRLLRAGLIDRYIADRKTFDNGVTLIGEYN